jgi:hypothetical protein
MTDPDFVNDVNEKDQRWGKQKTLDQDAMKSRIEGDNTMANLRKQVVDSHEAGVKQEWESKGTNVKESYQKPSADQTTGK